MAETAVSLSPFETAGEAPREGLTEEDEVRDLTRATVVVEGDALEVVG